MDRRTFLATLGSLAALDPVVAPAGNNRETVRTTSNTPPRKVIIGTVMQSFWGQYPGLGNRLEQLQGIIDRMVFRLTVIQERVTMIIEGFQGRRFHDNSGGADGEADAPLMPLACGRELVLARASESTQNRN